MYIRLLLESTTATIESENVEIERILRSLDYRFKSKPHPRGGLSVKFADGQIGATDQFIHELIAVGLRPVF